MASAHIVLVVDTTVWPREVVGAAIFSDPDPAGMGRVTIPLASTHAQTYEEAKALAERELASIRYEWVGRLETHPTRGVMRDARRRPVPDPEPRPR